jgi:hypothetical protein
MLSTPPNDPVVESADDGEGPVDALLRLASSARLYRSTDGRLHARVKVGDRQEIYGLKSSGFRDWLTDGYFADRREPPSQWAVRRVVSLLEARARFDGGTPSVCIRVGRGQDADGDGNVSTYFLDLGDPSGRAIQIRVDGWTVVARPDVHFRRPAGLLPLPLPSRDGSIDLLRPYANLAKGDFRLLVAWLTAALRPVGPYPILAIHGEQGSAKSTLARILRLLIDPQSSPLLLQPKSTRDLMATAVNGWLLAYDNISAIPNWLSDSLCQLVFGGGIAARALFSNDDRSDIHAQRPVILNGIEEFVRRGDLTDRTVFLHLPPILPTTRRAEDEFWSSFHADYPRIFGGVLDAVVGGLRLLPSVSLTELPRMADYAKWGEAVGQGLGWGSESFVSTYNTNRKDATLMALDDSAVGSVLLQIAPTMNTWAGSSANLLAALTKIAGKKLAASARWPKTATQFSNELRRVAPQLYMHGLSIQFTRNYEKRLILITRVEVPIIPASGVTPMSVQS